MADEILRSLLKLIHHLSIGQLAYWVVRKLNKSRATTYKIHEVANRLLLLDNLYTFVCPWCECL